MPGMVGGIGSIGGPGGIDPTGRAGGAARSGTAAGADRIEVSDVGKTLSRVSGAQFLKGKSPVQLQAIAETVSRVRAAAPDVREDRVAEAKRRLAGGDLLRDLGEIADRVPGPLVLRSR